MDHDEREQCLRRMSEVSNRFYAGAVACGNHAFLEFCGLMNEYIAACRDAHVRGEDFTEFTIHAGQHLPLAPYRVEYLNEKLTCIYGRRLAPEPVKP